MRLENAIRATPSNPTAQGCPVGLTGLGRRCWARTTESCLSRATTARGPIFTAGPAGLVAGAASMALDEYVPVSSQPDSDKSLLARDRQELMEMPAAELDELAAIYQLRASHRRPPRKSPPS